MNKKFPPPPKFGPPHLGQKQQTSRVQQPQRPGVPFAQPPLVAQRKATPVAPPPYRPQPVPKVLQTKSAVTVPHQPLNRPGSRTAAPHVFHPPPPGVVQPRLATPLAAKAPPPPRGVVPPQPFFNLSGVLQPKIEVEKNNGTYEVKGRPRFQGHVKKILVAKWNAKHVDQLQVKGLNLTYEGLDQCHKVSWSNIREWIERYLNKEITKEQLIEFSDNLYDGAAKTADEEWKTMEGQRAKLIKLVEQGKWKEVPGAVSQLGSILNSATPNLRLDSHDVNIRIQEHFDPRLVLKPDGKYSMTPHSKKTRANLAGQISSPRRTPKQTRAFSSSVDSPVPLALMSPSTRGGLAPKKVKS
jgi:hypothetical protein